MKHFNLKPSNKHRCEWRRETWIKPIMILETSNFFSFVGNFHRKHHHAHTHAHARSLFMCWSFITSVALVMPHHFKMKLKLSASLHIQWCFVYAIVTLQRTHECIPTLCGKVYCSWNNKTNFGSIGCARTRRLINKRDRMCYHWQRYVFFFPLSLSLPLALDIF